MSALPDQLVEFVRQHQATLYRTTEFAKVERAVGMLLESSLIDAPIGTVCELEHGNLRIPCEIVGFSDRRCFLMALAPINGVQSGSWLRVPSGASGLQGDLAQLPMLDDMTGRVVNGLAEPLDGKDSFNRFEPALVQAPINPMLRPAISETLDTGVAVINSLLTVGVGQRVGIFAGSGVGKSVFLGMLARQVQADVVVVGLIGERGREVAEFVQDVLGPSLARAVVVASPADDSPSMRLRAARLAAQLAEAHARRGRRVLLLMDSLTRVAQAQREIGLAMGEPAATKGYTPSSFAWLPRLVERAGRFTESGGSVTGFYTVLMEEDDLQDPVVDTARAILDGHIVLSRDLADQGIYPAVDVCASVSRLMNKLAPESQQDLAQTFRHLWHTYEDQRDLINLGAYRRGSDEVIDKAIDAYPGMCSYLTQRLDERVSMADALANLSQALAAPATEPSLIANAAGDFPALTN